MGVVVRRAVERDLGDVCRIMVSTDPFVSLGYTWDMCCEAALAALEEGWLLVGEVDGRVVGFIAFRVFDGFPLGGYVRAVAVEEGFRGLGVGSMLMDEAEKIIFGFRDNVFLLVSSFNSGAIAFYVRRGYEYVGEIRDAVIPGASEIIMRKRRSGKAD